MAEPEKVRILAISASPVSDGHTEQMLSLFCTRAFAIGAEVEILRLHECPIPVVTGKIEGWKPDPFWAEKIDNADALVVATPTYWFAPPGILKAWIDGLTPLTYEYELEGKLAGFIVYGPEGGAGNVAQYLGWVANNMGLLVPPYGLIWQEGPRRTGMNAWVYVAIPALADNLFALVLATREMVSRETSVTYLRERLKRYKAKGKKRIDISVLMEPNPHAGCDDMEPEDSAPISAVPVKPPSEP